MAHSLRRVDPLRLVRRTFWHDNIGQEGFMRRLVAIALVCAAALPTSGQTKTLLPAARVPSTAIFDSFRSIALPTACDEQGRLYVRLMTPSGDIGPVLRFSKTGVQEAAFDLSAAVGFNVFGVRPKGGVATVQDEQGYMIVNFGPDGKRESAVHLDDAHFLLPNLQCFPRGKCCFRGFSGVLVNRPARIKRSRLSMIQTDIL